MINSNFNSLIFSRLSEKVKFIDKTVLDRIDFELNCIVELNLTEYFIIAAAISDICHENNILHSPGISSTSGSLVNYCLGITNINPLEYNLIFERFLNKDVCDYVNIAFCIANGKLDFLLNELLKIFPDKTITQFIYKFDFQGLKEKVIYNNEEFYKSESGHIIANKDEEIEAKKIKINDKEYYIFDNLIINDNKSLKFNFDILQMDTLEKLKKLIDKSQDIKHPYKLSYDDPLVYNFLLKDDLNGLFCFSQNDARKMIPDFKPSNIIDLTIVDALAKPWLYDLFKQITSNKHNGYDRLMNNEEFNDILNETYGFLLFQETFLQLINIFAKFSLQKAEYYRILLTKCLSTNTILLFRNDFERACYENSSLDEVEIKLLSKFIIENVQYSISKSHYLSRAMIGYWTAYYKFYYNDFFKEIFEI